MGLPRWWLVGRLVLTAFLAASVLATLASPTVAQTSVDVATDKEAWYRTRVVGGHDDPACSSPAGCPLEPGLPADPYPEDTLHVGAVGNRQESATFLSFPLGTVPPGGEIIGGTVLLPVADQDSGTNRPEAAQLTACLVTEPFEPVQGGPPEEVPAVDCSTSADAIFEPEADSPQFSVDLTPFLHRWEQGAENHGIGLLMAEGNEEAWHVAFSASSREGDEAPPPSATLTWVDASSDRPAERSQAASDGAVPNPPNGAGDSDEPGRTRAPSASLTQPQTSRAPTLESAPDEDDAPAPMVAPEQEAATPTAATAQQAAVYAYPEAWLLPLVLLVGAGSLIRTLRVEVEVLADGAPRDLTGRLWLAFFPDSNRAGG